MNKILAFISGVVLMIFSIMLMQIPDGDPASSFLLLISFCLIVISIPKNEKTS